MTRFDRLYGKLNFPSLINELLDCPGLIRLRDIRLANVPFFSFPSFAGVSRYEHSLGVCNLANICAKKLELSEKSRFELMIASLYHDVGTPAFAHAIEEVFNLKYGFNHEDHLLELILGKNRDIGKNRTQLFFGRTLKLEKVCNSPEAKRIGIDIFNVAEIAIGSVNQKLSNLVRSNGIDLDNIDNVIRAASAMGVAKYSPELPIKLANSFIQYHDKYAFEEVFRDHIYEWINIRKILYKSIYNDINDLALQAMIKEAVKILIEKEKALAIEDWRITDEELIYNYLLKHNSTRTITKRFKLGQAYKCLIKLILKGSTVEEQLRGKINEIISLSYKIFKDSEKYANSKKNWEPKNGEPILIPYYFLDKSERVPGRPFIFFNSEIVDQGIKLPTNQVYFFFIFSSLNKEWSDVIENKFIDEVRPYLVNIDINKFTIDEQYI